MKKKTSARFLIGSLVIALCFARCADNSLTPRLSSSTKDISLGGTETSVATPHVVVKTDILYAQARTVGDTLEDLYLDLYFPPGFSATQKYPLAMLIHGGSYLTGDKTEMKNDCIVLADSGFVVASINYRMGWDDGVGQCDGDMESKQEAAYRALQDSNAAFRFLSARADKFGIDTTWFFVGGQSAGSSLALNTVYINNAVAQQAYPAIYAMLGPLDTSGNPFTNTFKIKGICNMWGAVPDSTLINSSNALPTISFHGVQDDVVPYNYGYSNSCPNYPIIYGSLCIHRQLLTYNKPTITNLVLNQGHGPKAYHPDFLMGNTACFFHRIIKNVPIRSRVDTSLISSCN